jgi:hypothetical protein
VSRGGGIIRVGARKEAVVEGAHTAKMVEGGRKEKHVSIFLCCLNDDGCIEGGATVITLLQ